MMRSRSFEWGVAAILAILVAADAALLVRAMSHAKKPIVGDPVRRPATSWRPSAPLQGFTARGEQLSGLGGFSRGVAVRYAAKACPYCAQDKHWENLSLALIRSGYKVVVLLPGAQEEYPAGALIPAGTPQVAFVSMDWIKQYRITMTPSLLLFDPAGRLIWHRQGVLTPRDVESALDADSVWTDTPHQ